MADTFAVLLLFSNVVGFAGSFAFLPPQADKLNIMLTDISKLKIFRFTDKALNK